uniref:PLAC8 family protein n=1 Tax=Helicotheca tamesis TaxID=374047 RepID=A0A7S2GUZ6_9STRA|mmetsp:Transcript_12230/g.16882  ORF Transcript_12230/g.16882 Transcript_12230/m.16882 type:complete len:298 (+) Transcript_12230:253-1146(+)|eukprot:CAMPEP_0185732094 /NCGR_PEP_ID=MMETSP1171-20130828/14965_1 /TAXON_ID=374046 /ORGANISM="Helicotheca tamensis, Strain CCMP826" /LENGTH=297 /DNA_ID=CAMNT_0028401499 /DNA_START=207 /DNA_END=1100 /DNA_ORIENTATION=-
MSSNDRNAYSQLDQSLIDVPPDTALPSTKATPMMEVVAPANLPEGYTFPVEIGDAEKGATSTTFTVTVPIGGIEEGQTFSVPLPGNSSTTTPGTDGVSRVSIPVGHWKDGLCNCCAYGCFHPLLWNSFFCIPIATAQVASRLNLNWYGRPGHVTETTGTFQKILFMVISYWILDRILILIMVGSIFADISDTNDVDYDNYEGDAFLFSFLAIVRKMLGYLYFIYTIVFLKNTRAYVRQKYAIPEREDCPKGCEDVCCAIACGCCAVSQMARHTTDYETYRGVCCSETGLPPHVPAIV